MSNRPDWIESAACRDEDPELFFIADETRFPARNIVIRQRALDKARAICGRCDVTMQCLDHAITIRAEGVWGGLTTDERKRLRRRKGVR